VSSVHEEPDNEEPEVHPPTDNWQRLAMVVIAAAAGALLAAVALAPSLFR